MKTWTRALDAWGRALLYCFLPRVIGLSLLPLLVLVAGVWLLMSWFWEPAITGLQQAIDGLGLAQALVTWLGSWGLTHIRSVLAPALLLFTFLPLLVVVSLLLVALLMMPVLVGLVLKRRFPELRKVGTTAWYWGWLWSLGHSALALFFTVLSLPFWLFPPAALILPTLIWGWLTSRVMAYDALSDVATAAERRALLQRHRYPLLVMGILTGCMGGAPAMLWASGSMWIAMAPLLVPLALWGYTLTFVFSGLWFAHYILSALRDERREAERAQTDRTVDVQARAVDPADSAGKTGTSALGDAPRIAKPG